MRSPSRPKLGRTKTPGLLMWVGITSTSAVVAAFLVAGSDLGSTAKAASLAGVVVANLLVCGVLAKGRSAADTADGGPPDLDNALAALEDLQHVVGVRDAFGLFCRRLEGVVGHDTAAIFRVDRGVLSSYEEHPAAGKLSESSALAAAAVRKGRIEFGKGDGVDHAVAIPLRSEGSVVAVLELSRANVSFSSEPEYLLEAVGERAAEFFEASRASEMTRSTALTHLSSDVPNERAFFMVLEHELAESLRDRDGRPLAVLSISVDNLDDVNARFGHASGDRWTGQIAAAVKFQLRQMDFFARAVDGEFLAVLPAASPDVARHVADRINTAMFSVSSQIANGNAVRPELSIGVASFGEDGETSDQLLAAARERRWQSNAPAGSSVIWFPKGRAN